MKVLPENYDFEVKKTVWRLRQANVKTLALQFPEGLLLYATTLLGYFFIICLMVFAIYSGLLVWEWN